MKTALTLFTYGGVEPDMMEALLDEVALAGRGGKVLGYARVHDDALISRSRSKALSDFLKSDFDVQVFVDHDVSWTPGDVIALAEQAALRQCMVAGMYSCRAIGKGIAGRLAKTGVKVHPGTDERYDAEYLPGGFLAIPRLVAEEVLKAGLVQGAAPNAAITECLGLDGRPFYDFFRPIVVPSTIVQGKSEFLSEDWAFSYRARKANPARPQYLWAKPSLTHWGRYGYTLLEAGQAEPVSRITH